ncbi:hypothetical protein M569_17665 [Genlisea aurea]|uniref:Uncharacterized protein n=1 Tax=Genlisea aurea TaxID=192259 RepID=S8BY99_9LAMI|nr:hypothetical protein M569_17665 [Genlisea aurea]
MPRASSSPWAVPRGSSGHTRGMRPMGETLGDPTRGRVDIRDTQTAPDSPESGCRERGGVVGAVWVGSPGGGPRVEWGAPGRWPEQLKGPRGARSGSRLPEAGGGVAGRAVVWPRRPAKRESGSWIVRADPWDEIVMDEVEPLDVERPESEGCVRRARLLVESQSSGPWDEPGEGGRCGRGTSARGAAARPGVRGAVARPEDEECVGSRGADARPGGAGAARGSSGRQVGPGEPQLDPRGPRRGQTEKRGPGKQGQKSCRGPGAQGVVRNSQHPGPDAQADPAPRRSRRIPQGPIFLGAPGQPAQGEGRRWSRQTPLPPPLWWKWGPGERRLDPWGPGRPRNKKRGGQGQEP